MASFRTCNSCGWKEPEAANWELVGFSMNLQAGIRPICMHFPPPQQLTFSMEQRPWKEGGSSWHARLPIHLATHGGQGWAGGAPQPHLLSGPHHPRAALGRHGPGSCLPHVRTLEHHGSGRGPDFWAPGGTSESAFQARAQPASQPTPPPEAREAPQGQPWRRGRQDSFMRTKHRLNSDCATQWQPPSFIHPFMPHSHSRTVERGPPHSPSRFKGTSTAQ